LFLFVLFFLLCLQAREAAKSATVLFNEAMEKYAGNEFASYARFEAAAKKGHEEAIWIGRVVKDIVQDPHDVRLAFRDTKKALGYYLASPLGVFAEEQDAYVKLSAKGGCSWGQVDYGMFFYDGNNYEPILVEEDKKVFVEWMEKAANQNNPKAMASLGWWFGGEWERGGAREGGEGGDEEKAVSYYRAAAALGWQYAMDQLAAMLSDGIGCVKDVRQAMKWSAQGRDSVHFAYKKNQIKEAYANGTV
jgi:TPR repeat protein